MHDFMDCTFLIPYRKGDNQDREDNLLHVLNFLNKFLKTNVLIIEQANNKTETLNILNRKNFSNLNLSYNVYHSNDCFHKTKLYNLGLKQITTEIVVAYDVDVLIPVNQLVEARESLNSGADYCYPFNGNYVEIPKELHDERTTLLSNFDFDNYMKIVTKLHTENEKISIRKRPPGMIRGCPPGGCVFIKRKIYIEMGMENEDFCGYGPEDAERKQRLKVFGYKEAIVNGNLYHIEHIYEQDNRRITSSHNRSVWLRLQSMDVPALMNHYREKNYKNKYQVA